MRRLLAALLVSLAVAACDGGPRHIPGGPVAPRTFFVSTHGYGTACLKSAPCGDLLTAMKIVNAGDSVVLLPGSYPVQSLGRPAGAAQFARDVVVMPAVPGTVTLAGIRLTAAHVVLRGVRIAGGLVSVEASHVTVDSVDVDGLGVDGGGRLAHQFAGVVVIGVVDDVTVSNSYIHGMVDRDGIDVGDASDRQRHLTFTGNRVDAAKEGPLKHHTDCFQVFGGQSDVTLTGNTFRGCSNSAVFLQAATAPVRDVRVADNLFVGCSPRGTGTCGYFTVYVQGVRGQSISDVTMTHNTIVGDVDFTTHPDHFSYNVLTGGYGYNECGGAWEDHNVIGTPPQRHYCPHGDTGQGDVSPPPR
jgi:hypothetical protein